MNCPNCGAVIKEGKFCNYCGAKLPDDTKRVEVNINKRIEDVAEIKRAEYETEESKLRRRQMKQDLRRGTFRRIVFWMVIGGGLASLCTYLIDKYLIKLPVMVYTVPALVFGVGVIIGMISLLFKD